MKLTDLLVCGFAGERVAFSANLTPQGVVTVWTSTDAQGTVTIHDNPAEPVDGFTSLIEALQDLSSTQAMSRPAITQHS